MKSVVILLPGLAQRSVSRHNPAMRISLIAYGTRGDVQPVLALARALVEAGHPVRMAAGSEFRDRIASCGVEPASSSMAARELMTSDDGRLWADLGTNPFLQARVMRRLVLRTARAMMDEAWDACRDADVILGTSSAEPFGPSFAQKLGVPFITTLLQPAFRATRSGAATWMAPLPGRSSMLNYAAGKLLVEGAFHWMSRDLVNDFRTGTLGLPPQSTRRWIDAAKSRPVLMGISRHVTPHPEDWPPPYHTTGYWFLDDPEPWSPPPGLEAFLENGEPPVAIGFGSMTTRDAAAVTQMLLEGVSRSGKRVVLLSGWAGIGNTEHPENVFVVDSAPHAWLFPRMAAAVHHGGSGTTAAALRAGIPQIVVPHLGDQPYWGRRMHELAVAPKPVPKPKLTALRLATTIREVTGDPRYAAAAEVLGALVRAEDGLAAAVELVERYALTERS